MTIDLTSAKWRKSSRSGGGNASCVEVADLAAAVAVRDSKNPSGPALAFARPSWAAFACKVKAGEFNL